jgi:hypothetical protein
MKAAITTTRKTALPTNQILNLSTRLRIRPPHPSSHQPRKWSPPRELGAPHLDFEMWVPAEALE